MAENMLANTLTIKNMDMESIIGTMEEFLKVSGLMENAMERVWLFTLTALEKLAIGKKIKE